MRLNKAKAARKANRRDSLHCVHDVSEAFGNSKLGMGMGTKAEQQRRTSTIILQMQYVLGFENDVGDWLPCVVPTRSLPAGSRRMGSRHWVLARSMDGMDGMDAGLEPWMALAHTATQHYFNDHLSTSISIMPGAFL